MVCVNNPSFIVNTFPKQKKVCYEEEVPHQVSLRCAAHCQPPALHEGMLLMASAVTVFEKFYLKKCTNV